MSEKNSKELNSPMDFHVHLGRQISCQVKICPVDYKYKKNHFYFREINFNLVIEFQVDRSPNLKKVKNEMTKNEPTEG